MVCIMSGSGHDFDGCSFRIFWNNKYIKYFRIFWNILAAVFDRFIVPKVWHKMVCIMSGSGHDFDGSSHYLTRAEGTLPHILTCDILLSCYILSCYILLSCFLFQSRNVHCGQRHRLMTQPCQILLREVAWSCTPNVDNLLCLYNAIRCIAVRCSTIWSTGMHDCHWHLWQAKELLSPMCHRSKKYFSTYCGSLYYGKWNVALKCVFWSVKFPMWDENVGKGIFHIEISPWNV